MATVVKLANMSHRILSRHNIFLCNTVRYYSKDLEPWPYLWKPGPYPKTEEERKKAAEKYNLHPSEYEPYPEWEELNTGDYPKLPDIPVEERDPYYPYDFPDLKRNYMEPFHKDIELLVEDRPYHVMKGKTPVVKGALTFMFVFLSFLAFMYFTEDKKRYPPVMKKQYACEMSPERAHYTFEPAD